MKYYWVLYTGMRNPRKPDEIGWREWDNYASLAEAKADARKNKLTFYIVVQCVVVHSVIPDISDEDRAREARIAERSKARTTGA